MAKINIKEIKRKAISVFDAKKDMLKHISKLAFKNNDRFAIYRLNTKWVVYLLDEKENKNA